MEKTPGHILKCYDVKLEGHFHLNVGQAPPAAPPMKNAAATAPRVRIVENQPEFAVIEVTCSCGANTHIRCEYTDAQSTDQETKQTK